MAFPYLFRKGKAACCLGSGAEGYGFRQPTTNPISDGFARRGYLVQRSMRPIEGAGMVLQQQATLDDISGGLGITGQMALQRLAQMNS